MSSIPAELKYSKSHEWVRVEGDVAVIGITDHAQDELGDIVYLSLPEVGRYLQNDENFGEVESVKAVSELFIPISGTVTEVNEALVTASEKINEDPYGAGWMLKLTIIEAGELDQLLSASAYSQLLGEGA